MTLREYTISDLQAVHDRLEARGWKGEPDGDDEVWEALFLVRTENHLSLSHVSHEDSLGLYFQRNDRKGPVIVESEVIELQRVMNG